MQQMIRELAKELRKGNTKFYFDKKRFLIVNKIFNNVDNLIKKKGIMKSMQQMYSYIQAGFRTVAHFT